MLLCEVLEPKYAQFGNLLRRTRIERGLTPNDVAKHLNVSRRQYTNYELGTDAPHDTTLQLLCNVLGLNFNEVRPLAPRVHGRLPQNVDVIEKTPETISSLLSNFREMGDIIRRAKDRMSISSQHLAKKSSYENGSNSPNTTRNVYRFRRSKTNVFGYR